jgi:ParB family chromosome partitioning protein
MPLQLKKVPVELCDYPSQPRSQLDPDYCRRLGESIKAHGQKVPIIGWTTPNGRFALSDGGCRLKGVQLVGITELLALDLCKEPSRADLLLAQASIDNHRQSLPPVDRANLLQAIIKENGWSARQLAESLQVSEAQISRALALLSLPEEVQRLVNAGELDPSKAYLLTQESDPARQVELAHSARGLSRAALAAQLRKAPARESRTMSVRLARVKIALPGGSAVTVAGSELSMEDVVQILADTLKEARKATEAKYDVKTWQRMMADRSKALGGTEHV